MMRMAAWVVLGSTAQVAVACATYAACLDDARAIVANMTVQAMAAQMTQLDIGQVLHSDFTLNEAQVEAYAKLGIGSYLNSPFAGGPKDATYGWNATEWRNVLGRIQAIHRKIDGHPILFGLDSVHGANYVANAVLFPHQINAGASFNRHLVYELGFYTARDTVAAGIPWIFGPILDVTSHKAWPRVYETFGEDPYLVTQMASQIVHGLQDNHTIAACFKHFIGYAATPSGHDRDPITLSDYEILNYYMPPFKAAIDAGALSGMMNYVSLNGVPMGANRKMLIDLLRGDLAFEGMLVTDWGVIDDLFLFHGVASSLQDAVELALTETSIDMSMVATNIDFTKYTTALYERGLLPLARLREAATRIVTLKLQLNLYDEPLPGAGSVPLIGDVSSQAAALAMATESIVLLKNTNSTLPLPANASVFLTGPAIDSIGHLCGGWSLTWQGNGGNTMFPHGQSVLSALKTTCPNCTLTSLGGVDDAGTYTPKDLAKATLLASQATYSVVVLGEGPYAEKPGDIRDLALPDGLVTYVRALAATKTKLILVLVEGRPRLLRGLPDLASAIVHAMLPGEMGGAAIASVLLGATNPSGRLPYTYPKTPLDAAVTYYHRRNAGCNTNGVFSECAPEWAFGTGLSYTRFAYSDVSVLLSENHVVTITLAVQNVGDRDGDHVVLLFLRQEARRGNVPEAKRLVFFEKLTIAAGSAKIVRAELRAKDWGIYTNDVGHGLEKHVSPGVYTLLVSEAADCAKGHCVRFTAGVHGTYTPTTTVQVAAQSHVASILRYHSSL